MDRAGNSFLEVDLSTVTNRRVAWILDYWNTLAPPGTLPSPKQIDPLDIPPDILPYIFKISVDWQDEEPRFTYRLSGTQLTKEYGREITGMTPRTAFPTNFAELEAAYTIAVKRTVPSLHRYRLPIRNKEHRIVERLICPCASDGETVDMMFGCLNFP